MKVKRVRKKGFLSLLLWAAIVCGFLLQGKEVTFAADNDVKLVNYLKTVDIGLKVNETDKDYSTLEQLKESGQKVPKGAGIQIALTFNPIKNVPAGANLIYQLPENLMDDSKADDEGIIFSGVVKDKNNNEKLAANWSIDKDGKLTVVLVDEYYIEHKHTDGTIDLFEFNINFSGSMSKARGETSGNGDNVLTFRGESGAVDDSPISYTIPFEYKNENSMVQLKKESTFNAADKTISYTITASTPGTNTMTSDKVTVTDEFKNGTQFLTTPAGGTLYQDASANIGTFNASSGVWEIGDMTPGTTATLTYKVQVDKSYFSTIGAAIKNIATADFNTDGTTKADNTLNTAGTGTLTITKEKPTAKTENGKTYLTYKLTVNAYGADVDNVVVKDAFNYMDAANSYSKVNASQGDIETKPADNGNYMQWNVGKVTVGTPATLEYKVELNGDAWDKYGTNAGVGAGRLRLSLDNTATVYDGAGTKHDSATTNYTSEKIYLTKSGSNPDSNNNITYTVKVNDNPVSSTIQYIKDELSATANYTSDITLNVYDYNGGELKTTYNVPLAKVKETNGKSWRINLNAVPLEDGTTVDLTKQSHYYTVSYKASAQGVINNSAGVGYGTGTPAAYITVSTAMSATKFAYNKEITDYDYSKKEGHIGWKITINSTIPANSGVEDILMPHSSRCSVECGCSYYTQNQIDNLTIKQGSKTLVKGTDYKILQYLRHDDDGTDDSGKERYYGFQIQFLKEIAATSSDPVTIQYQSVLNMEKVHANHNDQAYSTVNQSTFKYQIGTTNESSELEKTAYLSYAPNNEAVRKKAICYDPTTGEIVWYIIANRQSDVSGNAYIEETLPYGTTLPKENISILLTPYRRNTYSPQGRWIVQMDGSLKEITSDSLEYNLAGNFEYAYTGWWEFEEPNTGTFTSKVTIDYDKIVYGTTTDVSGRTCQTVKIPVNGIIGCYDRSDVIVTDGSWNNYGRFTIRIAAKLTGNELMNLTTGTLYENKVSFTQSGTYIYGETANAKYTMPTVKDDLLTKAEMRQEGPAYILYSMDINPNGLDLMSDGEPLTVIDTMEKGMSLATDHKASGSLQYFDVYDVSGVSSDTIYPDGKLNAQNVRNNGVLVTSQCTLKDITGNKVNGMASDDVGKPTYQITVPDSKHLVILYWVKVQGAEGETVSTSNKVNFFYNGSLKTNTNGEVTSSVSVSASSSTLFSGGYLELSKTNQYDEPVKGVKFTMYQHMDDGNDVAYMTVETDENGEAYFGYFQDGRGGKIIEKNTLYYIVETWAPDGYKVDSTPYYFELRTAGNDPLEVEGYEVHQLVSGDTITLVNEYSDNPKPRTDPTNPSDSSKSKSDGSKSKTSDSTSSSSGEDAVSVGSNPKVGDSSNIFLWMVLILASCSGLVGIYVFKKRRTRK